MMTSDGVGLQLHVGDDVGLHAEVLVHVEVEVVGADDDVVHVFAHMAKMAVASRCKRA